MKRAWFSKNSLCRSLSVATLVAAHVFTHPCVAALHRTSPKPSKIVDEKVYELDLSAIPQATSSRELTSQDVSKVIPTNLEATEDFGNVSRRIADHAFQNWARSMAVRNSQFGRAAQRMEHALKTDVTLGESTTAANESIEHKIRLQVEPTQGQAIVKYTGLVDANLSYKVASSEWSLEMKQKLSETSDVVINRTANHHEHIDNVSVRWTF